MTTFIYILLLPLALSLSLILSVLVYGLICSLVSKPVIEKPANTYKEK